MFELYRNEFFDLEDSYYLFTDSGIYAIAFLKDELDVWEPTENIEEWFKEEFLDDNPPYKVALTDEIKRNFLKCATMNSPEVFFKVNKAFKMLKQNEFTED
jgi:hypothetical protein